MSVLAALILTVGAAWGEPRTIDHDVAGVIDLFYDLRFDEARKAADGLAEKHPGHPAGPFYRSIVSFQRLLAEEAAPSETVEAFEKDSSEAVSAARRLLRADPAQGHFYLGIARGFRARVLAAQKRYLRAIPEALLSVHHLKAALELDPGLEDAYLGLGMYHYYRARPPAGARSLARLIPKALLGDPERGLAEIKRTAEKGGPARMEARSILAAISAREGRWHEADALLAELTALYPRNPLYRLRRVYVASRRGDWERAVSLADPGARWIEDAGPGLRPRARAESRYRAAEALILWGKPEKAEPLIRDLEASEVRPSLRDWVLLRRGNLLDAQGRAAEAQAAYRRVADKDAAAVAGEFLANRYPRGPKTVKPWRGPETPP